jgi:hypothetical protein
MDAQPNELPPPGVRALPLFLVVEAHASPQPLVQFRNDAIELVDTEVIHPTDHVSPEFPQHAEGRDPSATAGDLLYSFLEPLQGLLCPDDYSPDYLKSQKGTFGFDR